MPPHFWFNDLDHETRIRTQMLTNAIGEVVMFTLQLELSVEDRWYPVVRYDTAHAEAHIDFLDPRGVTYDKDWLGVHAPFNSVFTLAEDELKDSVEEHRERFLRQLEGKRP